MKRVLRIVTVLGIAFMGFAAVTTDHGKYFEISKNIEIFTNLYKEINTYYVDEIDPAKLMRTGVDAMLESLDPYTNYISESEIEGFRYITEGKYNGIGAMIKKTGNFVTITEPYEDCPAHKAGLKAGDIIKAIDGKSAEDKTTDEISNILKGYPGTEVELTIERPGGKKDMKVIMIRDEIKVPNVPYSGMISENVGYIALTTFTRNAGKNVGEALKKLKAENPSMKGVVFDLRGNGGGLLTEAVNVSNVFVAKNELIVTTKGKVTDWDRSFKTLNKPVDEKMPLVLLIDKGSASASEIVSGVIQDLDRGVLMGQRSYGKGLVQNTRDVGYNSKVKLTTAKYYIPSKRCIQGVSYEDGKPIDIPDSLRTPFRTRNNRVVLDGGGIKPDILLEKRANAKIIRSLFEKNLIFDFVTSYVLEHETIAIPEDFDFTGFNDFMNFLEGKDYVYDTKTEKMLEKLKTQAEKDELLESIQTTIDNLKTKIHSDKKDDLIEFEKELTDLIEREIASRYYFQEGKIKVGLKNDDEIKDAIKLLSDNTQYNKILSN